MQRYIDTAKTKKCVLPCTPLAVVKALEHLDVYDHGLPEGNRLRGKKVTVINRSEVVGRPLAAMLANDGAQVRGGSCIRWGDSIGLHSE